ncbi:MAG TPA: PilT/PilU family type 4a pilus ATPase [Armatimonadota bacterium]|jgi:twitching motility protein PilT
MDFTNLLNEATIQHASDVFLKEHAPPALRLAGRIVLTDYPALTNHDIRQFAQTVMTPDQVARFDKRHEMDIAFTIPGLSRFRANIFQQRGSWCMVLRLVPLYVQTLDELKLPQSIRDLTTLRQGLVLVTGPTGSGKSTTLAAMIDEINSTRNCNIVTVEDPIEFVHADKLCIVAQREVGVDTDSFTDALKYVVRQSPDVILIGEMRDIETMNVALAAAETGHLVFSTVHTSSAAETVDRIINMFPPHAKVDVCTRLAKSLRGCLAQKLVPSLDGLGRVAAIEVMLSGPTISKLIEEGRSGSIAQAMGEDRFYGMQTMNEALFRLVVDERISEEDALTHSPNAIELKQMMRRK